MSTKRITIVFRSKKHWFAWVMPFHAFTKPFSIKRRSASSWILN